MGSASRIIFDAAANAAETITRQLVDEFLKQNLQMLCCYTAILIVAL